MARQFTTLSDFFTHGADTLIDVRSPAEFAIDHVPGAINLPVLSNDERAEVGTIYKQQSAFLARKIGAALVARNAAAHLEGPLREKDGGWRPLVYCWRGGQRSGSFAMILTQVGWRAETVVGGYQAYRRLVAGLLHDQALPHRFLVVDGDTGTAKTELLGILATKGAQVLDLEALANHRGSLFGATGTDQPAQRQFESRLAQGLTRLDPAKITFVEAESSRIGAVSVPPSLWVAMQQGQRVIVKASAAERAAYLARRYSDVIADPDRLAQTLTKLTQVQGRERIATWQALAVQGDHVTLAGELIAHHYDPRYAKQRGRQRPAMAEITAESLGEVALTAVADQLLELARNA